MKTCGLYIPNHLTVQWHITERCNLRCRHCYQNSFSENDLSLPQLLGFLTQIKEMASAISTASGRLLPVHLNITGGEPFIRNDFEQIVKAIAENTHFSYAILSNGSLLTTQAMQWLKTFPPRFVQVSIEGSETTNDRIRSKGSYRKTISAIRQLKRIGVRVMVSFTASKENYREFPEVAKLARRMGVDKLWADRYLPIAPKDHNVLNQTETKEFFELMKASAQKQWWQLTKKQPVVMDRALQFLVAENTPYACAAGDTLLTIMHNGDVYPCRRMPVKVSNLLNNNLLEVYQNHHLLRRLRSPAAIPEECSDCFFARFCRGGLKCLSYSLLETPFLKDPACWEEE